MSDNREQLVQQFFVNSAVLKRQASLNYFQAAGKAGLSLSQSELIFLVMQNEPLNLKSLSRIMQLSPGAITQLVEGLVKAGYLIRNSDLKDRRVQLLSLSAKGRQKIIVIRKYHLQRSSEIAKILTDKELKDYLNIQNKMISYFSNQKDIDKKNALEQRNAIKLTKGSL